MIGETTPLRNREMHLDWKPEFSCKRAQSSLLELPSVAENLETDVQSAKGDSQRAKEMLQSANSALPLPPKCKNCTLEEIAVLRIVQQNPSAKQTFIAKEIKKSERTVKTITARLTEKGIIKRSKGKGSDWLIIYN